MLVIGLIGSLLGNTTLAQQGQQGPQQSEGRRSDLLDQAVRALREQPPAVAAKSDARAFALAQAQAPASSRPILRQPWFWVVVAGAILAGTFLIANSGDDEEDGSESGDSPETPRL
jgi:hypothetical protein